MNSMMSIVEVKPTALFSASKPSRQLAYLKFRNSGDEDLFVEIKVDVEGVESSPVSEETAEVGDSVFDIWIPNIDIPRSMTIQITGKNRTFPDVSWQGLWQPQRKWKVHIIKASHYDLGYDGRVDHMQSEAADYLDLAKRLCEDKAQLHEWHYHIEHMGFMRAYERERKESELRVFIEKYLKTGLMTLFGNPSGPHWHWMDYEQIARASYPARREMKDRFGLEVESIGIADNPSGSWAAHQAFAKSGFKYVFRFGQQFRGPGSFKDLNLPKVSWLLGPNGRDKILCYLFEAYGESLWIGQAGAYGADYVERAARELSHHLLKVESGEEYGEYPYDTLIVSNYADWEIPHEDERILAAWRSKWRYPEIHLEDAGKAMAHIKANYGSLIPVLKGDTNNNSGDYSSIDPLSQGIKRSTTRMLPFLEGLYAVAAHLDPQIRYHWKVFNDLYIRLVEYDEHCWPTMLPGNDMNIFNTNIVKTHQAKKIYSEIMKLIKEPIGVILENSNSLSKAGSSGMVLSVWNSLIHQRSDLVRFHTDGFLDAQIKACRCPEINAIDVLIEESYPAQISETGEIVFVARDIPAYGYKNFIIKVRDMADDRNESRSALIVSEDDNEIIIENKFYKLAVNKTDGRVVSLDDRRLNLSLIDPQAPYAFNQWLRVSVVEFGYQGTSKDITIQPIGISTAHLGQVGPVMAGVVVETENSETGVKIISTYTLYNELDRLDINNKALRMDFLHTPVKDRYKENVFVAFPFNVDKPRFRAEHSTGTVDPATDLLPSIKDFMVLNRWIDVGNEEYGITLVSNEAAAMHLGKIMYNQFSADHIPEKSYLYSYVWSNRMSGLTALGTEDYHAELTYSIHFHKGDWVKGNAAGFGWGHASPLLGAAVPQRRGCDTVNDEEVKRTIERSFVSADSGNIQMTVLKRAEKPGCGYISRLVETEGRDRSEVKINVSFLPVARAWLCDPVENDLEEVQVEDGAIKLSISSYDVVTIRFTTMDDILRSISHADAGAVDDSKVQLEWSFDGDFANHPSGVNIYRSEDPGFTPTAHTLIVYVEGERYIDSGLKPGCAYYYYLAPADRDNRQGNLFGPIQIRTVLGNGTAPLPLEELAVIPMDIDRLTVYWRRSPEPDIAQYKVYRSGTPDFEAADENLIAVVEPDKYWYQTYNDVNVKAGETWYYRVFPVDYAGNVQEYSECVSGKTPYRKRLAESRY